MTFSRTLIIVLFLSSLSVAATVCGAEDRLPSFKNAIGRLNIGCTVTMIGRSTAITAGHCIKENAKFVEFNVLRSDRSGRMTRSNMMDIYPVIKNKTFFQFIEGRNLGDINIGNDYAILSLGRNKYTKKLPGDVQGSYKLDIRYIPQPGDLYSIVGYGTSKIKTLSLVQKRHKGWSVASSIIAKKGILRYRVDTTGGNSGSAIINLRTNRIIGIHTNGGCNDEKLSWDKSANHGVLISAKPKLIRKLKDFLREERQQLR